MLTAAARPGRQGPRPRQPGQRHGVSTPCLSASLVCGPRCPGLQPWAIPAPCPGRSRGTMLPFSSCPSVLAFQADLWKGGQAGGEEGTWQIQRQHRGTQRARAFLRLQEASVLRDSFLEPALLPPRGRSQCSPRCAHAGRLAWPRPSCDRPPSDQRDTHQMPCRCAGFKVNSPE